VAYLATNTPDSSLENRRQAVEIADRAVQKKPSVEGMRGAPIKCSVERSLEGK
jgi:hypothetical protein